jgi:hypothetical protein
MNGQKDITMTSSKDILNQKGFFRGNNEGQNDKRSAL